MKIGQQTPSSWARPREFLLFAICVTVIGVAAAAHWRALDIAFAFAILGFWVIGSSVLLWRTWKHRREPGQVQFGQLAVLPPSWRRWVLGESKDHQPK